MGEIIWTTHTIPLQISFLTQLTINPRYRRNGSRKDHLRRLEMGWIFRPDVLAVLAHRAVLIAGYVFVRFTPEMQSGFSGSNDYLALFDCWLCRSTQMIGYLLLIAELVLIHLAHSRSALGSSRCPSCCALDQLHASFILGIILAAVILFIPFSAFSRLPDGTTLNPRARRMMAFSLLLSLAALFLNPSASGRFSTHRPHAESTPQSQQRERVGAAQT